MARKPEHHRPDEADYEIEGSSLDELTHAELLMYYHECATSVRFAKTQQWKTLGATLATLMGLIVIGYLGRRHALLLQMVTLISILVSTGSLYILIVFQLRLSAEREKLQAISGHFSNLLRDIRALRGPREAAFHRYTMLLFQAIAILGACAITVYYMALLK